MNRSFFLKSGTLVRLVIEDGVKKKNYFRFNYDWVPGYDILEILNPTKPYINATKFEPGTTGLVLDRFKKWDGAGTHYKILVNTKILVFRTKNLEKIEL